MKYHQKQIKALELAIQTMTRERRKLYAVGNHAFRYGVRMDILNADGVTGELFVFAEDGHKGYLEYTQAINELEDLKDILLDPGVVRESMDMFSNIGAMEKSA